MRVLAWLMGLVLLCLGIYLQIEVKTSAPERLESAPDDARALPPEEPAAVAALRAAIRNGETDSWPEPELIKALSSVESAQAVSVLDDLSLQTTDRDVFKQILQALETAGGVEAVRLLYRIGKKENDLAELAAVRLSRIHDRAAAVALVDVLEREGGVGPFAAAATRALGRTRLRHYVPRLIELAREGDLGVRLAAVDGLGAIADSDALPILIDLLRDPGARVRRQAIRALSRIRSPGAIEALEGFLQTTPSPPPFEASLAQDSLARQRGVNPGPWRR